MWTLNPMYGFFQSVCIPDCAKEKIADFLASAWATLNAPEFGLGNSTTECEGLVQPPKRAAVSASVRLDMMRMMSSTSGRRERLTEEPNLNVPAHEGRGPK